LQKDDAVWILDKFRKADGVILATPVYYYNVSAQMKAFIDRNYFLYKHNQKYKTRVVGIIVIAGGDGIEDTLHTLRQFIDELNVKESDVFILSGYATNMGDAGKNLHLLEEARNLGRQMVECLKRQYTCTSGKEDRKEGNK
jgi:multimeric flavodoxin WrbA